MELQCFSTRSQQESLELRYIYSRVTNSKQQKKATKTAECIISYVQGPCFPLLRAKKTVQKRMKKKKIYCLNCPLSLHPEFSVFSVLGCSLITAMFTHTRTLVQTPLGQTVTLQAFGGHEHGRSYFCPNFPFFFSSTCSFVLFFLFRSKTN